MNQPKQKRLRLRHRGWWIIVALSIIFLLAGQSVGTLLGQFYYKEKGNSKWIQALVQTAGFPILIPPYFFYKSSSPKTSITILAFAYFSVGLVIALDCIMYSYGLLYLPVSTFSLICATQLAFNALFSYFLNSQKFTPLVLNSIVLLTFSASLIAIQADETDHKRSSTREYITGFLCTLGASAIYSLVLSLTQLFFDKIVKEETVYIVLEMQIYPAAVASCACVVGLFASGEWKELKGNMDGFRKGRVSYVMTLVGIAVSWQAFSVGCLMLIYEISSLFSNVISTLGLPVVPILAVIFFHDKMDGVKIVAMLLALWGFLSYIYQQYLDDSGSKRDDVNEASRVSTLGEVD